MPARQPVHEPVQPVPGDAQIPVPGLPEPDMQSPLHPEAPSRDHLAQIVAVGSDQVRGYLGELGMPAEEIGRVIAEARQAGAARFACPPAAGRPAEQLNLSFAGEVCQLAIENAAASR
jgi:hypothetical protein